jgi:hypothetical protein
MEFLGVALDNILGHIKKHPEEAQAHHFFPLHYAPRDAILLPQFTVRTASL